MKYRPILFSAPMVRELLDGSKTQTRRVVKAKHLSWLEFGALNFLDGKWNQRPLPYGQPGDRLWVRENFQYRGASYDGLDIDDAQWFRCYGQGGAGDNWDPEFPEDWEPSPHMGVRKLTAPEQQEGHGVTGWVTKLIPAIHMPRWASRITLQIVSVRVERLQDISEGDAVAEGIRISSAVRRSDACYGIYECLMPDGKTHFNDNACDLYRKLWEFLHGAGSWDANPWVWVIEFKRVEGGAA